MARKVIIDCDPGIDDAVALCYALFEPTLEIVAITAVEGRVSAVNATRNVQGIIEQLDPPRFPRTGAASPLEGAPHVEERALHGDDGLGNCDFAVAQLHQHHLSEKIICDAIRTSRDPVTIICLGPLTNIAKAFQRDPTIEPQVDRIIMVGGAVRGVGDVTPAAELNIYYDAASARTIFRSRTTKTLIPLDVTSRLPFTLDFVKRMPSEETAAGWVTRRSVSHLFRAYHQAVGRESVPLQGAVGLVAAVHPEWIETAEMAGDVEHSGELTHGTTVFDRRLNKQWRDNMEVAIGIDTDSVMDELLRGIQKSAAGGI